MYIIEADQARKSPRSHECNTIGRELLIILTTRMVAPAIDLNANYRLERSAATHFDGTSSFILPHLNTLLKT